MPKKIRVVRKIVICAAIFVHWVSNPVYGGSPLYSFNEFANLYFDGAVNVLWDSNIFRDEDSEEGDVTYVFSPGLELVIGSSSSKSQAIVRTNYDIIQYQDNDHLDKNNFHISANGGYSGHRLDLSGLAQYDEKQITSGESNKKNVTIDVEDVKGRVLGEYRLSPKFSFKAGADYFERSYVLNSRDEFADYSYIRFPLDLFYEWTSKIDLSAGYTYKDGKIDDYKSGTTRFGGYDYKSHFYNVGIRGSFSPKLSGFFKVGYRSRESGDSYDTNPDGVRTPSDRGSGSNGHLGLDSGLTWKLTQKSIHSIVLERDFGVGGEGHITEISRIKVNSSYSVNSQWSANSELGYTIRDYQSDDREDKQYLLGFGLRYSANEYWSFSGGYRYHENNSTRSSFSYTSHNLYLTARLRY